LSKEGAVSVITAAFPTISREQAIGIVAGVQSGKIIPTTEKEKQAAQDGQQDEGQGGTPVPETPKAPVAPTGLSQKKSNLEELQNLSQHEWKMLIAGMMGGIELGKYDGIDFTPPEGARESAKRALDVREEKPASQKGMTPVGIARARDLINGVKFSPDTVRRMKAFFDRHEVDKKGETWDEQGKGWQAWNGWGGDAGYSWAKKVVGQMESRDKNLSDKNEQTELAEENAILNPCGMKDDGTFDDENSCANGYGRPKLVGGYKPKRPGGKIPPKPTKPTPPPTTPAPVAKPEAQKPTKGAKGAKANAEKERARLTEKMSKGGAIVTLPENIEPLKKIEEEYDNLIKKGYAIPPPKRIITETITGRTRNSYAVARAQYLGEKLAGQQIVFNRKYDKDGEAGLAFQAEKHYKSGFFSATDTLGHEYAHIMHREKLTYAETLQWTKSRYGLGAKTAIEAGKRVAIASKVSEYAKENPMEFVAETFAGHVSGKKYSSDVYELYDLFKGPKLK
jgi:hypothetical protein